MTIEIAQYDRTGRLLQKHTINSDKYEKKSEKNHRVYTINPSPISSRVNDKLRIAFTIDIRENVIITGYTAGTNNFDPKDLKIWIKEGIFYKYITYDYDNKKGKVSLINIEDYNLYNQIFKNDTRFDKSCLIYLSENPTLFNQLKFHYNANNNIYSGFRYSIYKYQYCSYLDFDEKILDGFFDVGTLGINDERSGTLNNFLPNGRLYNDRYKDRKIIICDSMVDEILKKRLNTLKFVYDSIKKYSDNKINYQKLAVIVLDYVNKIMPSSGRDDKIEYNDSRNTEHTEYIGNVQVGVCRHKAILYKYFIDNLNDPNIKCSLNRGPCGDAGHAWNTVLIQPHDQIYVIDPRNRTGLLSMDQFYEMFKYQVGMHANPISVAVRHGGGELYEYKYKKYKSKYNKLLK